jgi:hypothetical protein
MIKSFTNQNPHVRIICVQVLVGDAAIDGEQRKRLAFSMTVDQKVECYITLLQK